MLLLCIWTGLPGLLSNFPLLCFFCFDQFNVLCSHGLLYRHVIYPNLHAINILQSFNIRIVQKKKSFFHSISFLRMNCIDFFKKNPFERDSSCQSLETNQAFTISVHILQCLSCLVLYKTCFVSAPKHIDFLRLNTISFYTDNCSLYFSFSYLSIPHFLSKYE